MARCKNSNWGLDPNHDGTYSLDHATLAVLMDIRDELQQLNRVFACSNFLEMPRAQCGAR